MSRARRRRAAPHRGARPAARPAPAAHGRDDRQLDAIVVDVGPGLFTGLRVGIAFAKGLSVATGAASYGLEYRRPRGDRVRRRGPRLVLAVVDARRGEVFAARYDDGRWPVAARRGLRARRRGASRRGSSRGDAVTAVGDGAVRYRAVLEAPGRPSARRRRPSPVALRLVATPREAGALRCATATSIPPTYARPTPRELRRADGDAVSSPRGLRASRARTCDVLAIESAQFDDPWSMQHAPRRARRPRRGATPRRPIDGALVGYLGLMVSTPRRT